MDCFSRRTQQKRHLETITFSIVTVPIPRVSGLPVATSVTASAAILGLPMLATKLLPVTVIVTTLSAFTCEIGNWDIASKPKFINNP